MALHVAGTGEVRFKDIAIKDLARRITPAEQVGVAIPRAALRGLLLRVVGGCGRLQPRRRARRHHRAIATTSGRRSPSRGRSTPVSRTTRQRSTRPAMVNFAFDYTGDGWDDILVVESRTPVLYVNPKGESRRWTRYAVFTTPVISESIMFKDVNGDGKPDAIYCGAADGAVGGRRSGESDRHVEDLHRLAARGPGEHPRHRRRRHQRRRQARHHRAARLVGAAGRRARPRRRGRSTRARSAGTATPAATSRSTMSTATSCRTSSPRSPPTASGSPGTSRSATRPGRSPSSSTSS